MHKMQFLKILSENMCVLIVCMNNSVSVAYAEESKLVKVIDAVGALHVRNFFKKLLIEATATGVGATRRKDLGFAKSASRESTGLIK